MAPFPKILCAVEGSQASIEAARQAVALAAPPSKLEIIAVSRTLRHHLVGPPHLSEEQLREALRGAIEMARKAGISASSQMRSGRYAPDVLLAQGRSHDLTVIGSHGHSRAAGISRGRTATELVHKASQALLVARKPPNTDVFPEKVLLASDGSPGSWAPTRVATQLDTAFGSEITVLHVSDAMHIRHHSDLDAQIAAIEEATGSAPKVIEARGWPAHEIVETATRERSSLVVIGHRGVWGLHALASVSERVAHRAPCSVLLAPDGKAEGVALADSLAH
jgi:nucleotide-binding universal stress UspA family protein